MSFIYLLGYYILKNRAIWFTDSILTHNSRTRILPDMGLVSITILFFILDYFQEQLMTKFSKKSKKSILRSFLTLFIKIWGKWIFLVKRTFSVFKYSNYLRWGKNAELTDRQTDNSDFVGPNVGQRSKKLNL